MYATERPLIRASARMSEDTEPTLTPKISRVQFERLSSAKREVGAFKAANGDRAWKLAVFSLDCSAPVFERSRFISRAVHKLTEIVATCAIPPPQRSLHLGEAPGGFVQGTHLFLKELGFEQGWSWVAVSLPGGIAFDTAKLPMTSGRTVLCDMLRVDDAVEAIGEGTFDMVTADGAIEMDHSQLEEEHFPLARAETDIALRLLSKGGTYIVKLFEAAERRQINMIAKLTMCFANVSMIKPRASRATNSELYLVCTGYDAGSVDADFLAAPPESVVVADGWTERYLDVAGALAGAQTDAIERTLQAARQNLAEGTRADGAARSAKRASRDGEHARHTQALRRNDPTR